MNIYRKTCIHSVIIFWILLVACGPSISLFSPQAYQNATSLKIEALNLMSKATEPYPQHAAEVSQLVTDVDKAYEYAKGYPKNEISTEQWAILKNPEGNLLGGFLMRWGKDTTLSKGFISEVSGLVSDAFDTIIELESKKIGAK